MLILSRKMGQDIVVPDLGITIRVVEFISRDREAHKVKIGIDAPAEIRFYRREVWDRIQQREQGEKGD